MKLTAIPRMPHAFASDEVIEHALASDAFEPFEAASCQTLVTAAREAGEREVASAFSTVLRQEEAMAARRRERLPQLTQQFLQRPGDRVVG